MDDQLHPMINKVLDTATDGLPLLHSAIVRSQILQRIKDEALCGLIMPSRVCQIAAEVLTERVKEITQRLEELSTGEEGGNDETTAVA